MTEINKVDEAFVQAHRIGDIASGTITISINDEELVYRVPYDTIHGPDGGSLRVDAEVGEEINTDNSGPQRLTDELRDLASEVLFYYNEDRSLVTSTGIHGINDGWTPSN